MGNKNGGSSSFQDRRALKPSPGGKVVEVAWSPKGDALAAIAGSSTARVWNTDTWKQTQTFNLPGPYASSIAVSKNRVAIGLTKAEILIFSRTSDASIFTIGGEHSAAISSVRFNSHRPDLLLSGSLDGSIKLWDLQKRSSKSTFTGKATGCTKVAWSNGGVGEKCFLGSFDDATVKLFDARKKKEALCFSGHESDVNSVAWAKDDSFFASASSDSTCCLWDHRKPDKPFKTLAAPRIKGEAVDVSIGGQCPMGGGATRSNSDGINECFVYVAYDESPFFAVWPAGTSKSEVYMSPALSKRVTCVEVSPSGKHFATGDWGKQVIAWGVAECKKADWFTAGHTHI